jgi:glutamine amidotransferase
MNIRILDLGINNLNSVRRVFESCITSQDSIEILSDCSDLSRNSDLLVLPGMGKFSAGMEAIRDKGFDELILNHVSNKGKIAGICLGMHLLGHESEESEDTVGLRLISGSTKRFKEQKGERIPNIGWLGTKRSKKSSHFNALDAEQDFYFVHSYEFKPENENDILCKSLYGKHEFVSGVLTNEICAFQFHPEKSAKIGKSLVYDLIEWAKHEV